MVALGGLPGSRVGELALVVGIKEGLLAVSSAATQAQIQGFELTQPQIYIICELFGLRKGLVLPIPVYYKHLTLPTNSLV